MKHYDVVAAVICRGDKILCMQKGNTKYAYTSYKYEFPGGKIEPGETGRDALHRELIEEMDYDVAVGREIVTVNHDYPDFSISLTAYYCEAASADFHMNEHVGYKWCSCEELSKIDWAAADVAIAEAVVSGK